MNVAISPNGKHITYVTADPDGRLWLQDLDQQLPRPIEGTEEAYAPFWSPGSDFIAFATQQELRKVSVEGGPSIQVCQIPGESFWEGSWSPDGASIVFSANFPLVLYEVPAQGGDPSRLVSPDDSDGSSPGVKGLIADPRFLPSETGSRILVYADGGPYETFMMVQDLDTGRRKRIGPGANPFYSPSGHLVYESSPLAQDLWALPFSIETLEATGEAFPIAQNSRFPTVSTEGTLVYVDGSGSGKELLLWRDRDGNEIKRTGSPHVQIRFPKLSPDGRRVAVKVVEKSYQDIWVYEIARDVRTRLTSGPHNVNQPAWSPTGEEVAFSSLRSGNWDIFLGRVDGSEEEKALAATPQGEIVCDWSRDGTYLIYELTDPEATTDLWYLKRTTDARSWEAHPFLQTAFNERAAQFSPDGRFVAYSSDESGRHEVYVRPFPEGAGKDTVSSKGGGQTRWSRDGRELFYVEGTKLMVVAVSTEPTLSISSARPVFEVPKLRRSSYQEYDVSVDGQRFIFAESIGEAPKPSIRVVQNWFAEFRDRQEDQRK